MAPAKLRISLEDRAGSLLKPQLKSISKRPTMAIIQLHISLITHFVFKENELPEEVNKGFGPDKIATEFKFSITDAELEAKNKEPPTCILEAAVVRRNEHPIRLRSRSWRPWLCVVSMRVSCSTFAAG
ncbi:hypothetical protein CAPTEDRAFT_194841 [Capitella teleta]|uniref:Uncharacterized protein n=1 Tax=Capitella teleta TaxID=283909 RepID=R7T899_CAPTE|nr:hypothetical protein CAPTEDRAFT_194841 [Capitella teleta]|eukprot:ELT87199.1 hypothetical protein CAPTEDRAFT_194841 [Capitella teleta]